MAISIDDTARLSAIWKRAHAQLYQQLADAFPDQDPELLFAIGIVSTLAWTLRKQPVDAEVVAEALNQMLASGHYGHETGWRLIRMA